MISILFSLLVLEPTHADAVDDARASAAVCTEATRQDPVAQLRCFQYAIETLVPLIKDEYGDEASFQSWSDDTVGGCNHEAQRGSDLNQRNLIGLRCYYHAALKRLGR